MARRLQHIDKDGECLLCSRYRSALERIRDRSVEWYNVPLFIQMELKRDFMEEELEAAKSFAGDQVEEIENDRLERLQIPLSKPYHFVRIDYDNRCRISEQDLEPIREALTELQIKLSAVQDDVKFLRKHVEDRFS